MTARPITAEVRPPSLLRIVVSHGVFSGAAAILLSSPTLWLPGSGVNTLIAAACIALALVVPAVAARWAEARDLPRFRILGAGAVAGALVLPLVVVQGAYLAGVVAGGFDAAYANLTGVVEMVLHSGTQGWLQGGLLLGCGAGHGALASIVVLVRRIFGEARLRVMIESAGSSVSIGVGLTFIGGLGSAVVHAVWGGPGIWTLPFAVPLGAGLFLIVAIALVPIWVVVFAAASRLDVRLARLEHTHGHADGQPHGPTPALAVRPPG